jgi:hypothetical protein
MEWVPGHFCDYFQIKRNRTMIEWYSKGAAQYKSDPLKGSVA